MSISGKQLGTEGEELASAYLIRRGFHILARNVHARMGEIDIVARRQDRLHFIEVKTRSSLKHGQPYEAVQSWKVQHLKKAAYIYMMREGISRSTPLSMDVISILQQAGTRPLIKMYKNIDVRE